jgi:hypothetical protein
MVSAHVESPQVAVKGEMDTNQPPLSTDERFVIRLWTDSVSMEGDKASRSPWHGQIIRVGGSEQHYVSRLSEINDFIVSVLQGMGVRCGYPRRFLNWIYRLVP